MTGLLNFPWVADADRIVVTGGAGWLGRELIARLQRLRPEIPLLVIASTPRSIEVDGSRIDVIGWDAEAIRRWRPTLVVHLAYLTREHERELGTDEYVARNSRLTTAMLDLFAIDSLRGVVVASSGAAVALRDGAYGRLKAWEEERFLAAGHARSLPTIVARIWSVSGGHCNRPRSFALYDLIGQARDASEIRIRASHAVWRRYVDAGEYLETCLSAAASGATDTIESAGELVELAELAETVQSALGVKVPVLRPQHHGADDRYFSQDGSMEAWGRRLGLSFSDLARQVVTSAGAVPSGWSSSD